METCDDDFVAVAGDWIRKQHAAGEPFFCWLNTTHMHLRTHTKPESIGQAGQHQSPYHDTMVDHDKNVGQMLDLLDELGIAEDTVVVYSTDNGPHMNTWPDGAMTPFRSEKNTNWEGAFRVPELIRWPGKIPAGAISNEIVQHHDWLPTFLAMAGEPNIIEKCKKGHKAGDKNFKVHIDGFNLMPYLTGKEKKSPREGFIYFSDDGDLVALRCGNWKAVFMEQRCKGTLEVWAEPFTALRIPKLYNLRTDPFERADITSNTYWDWYVSKAYMILAAQGLVSHFLATFKDFPPRQKAASFTIDQVMEKMESIAEQPGSLRHRRKIRGALLTAAPRIHVDDPRERQEALAARPMVDPGQAERAGGIVLEFDARRRLSRPDRLAAGLARGAAAGPAGRCRIERHRLVPNVRLRAVCGASCTGAAGKWCSILGTCPIR